MTKFLGTVLLSLAVSISAVAVSGTGVTAGGLDPSCRILLLSHQTQEIMGLCSGTLTGATEVSTAGHCVLARPLEYYDYQVDCGYSGFEPLGAKTQALDEGFSFYIKGPLFKEIHTVSAIQIGKEFGTVFKGNDVAKLTLAEASALTPASVAATADISTLYFDSLGKMRPQVNCIISGFGESNGDDAGKLNRASLTAQSQILSMDDKMQIAMSVIQPPEAELTQITTTLNEPYYWLDGDYLKEFMALTVRVPLTIMPGDSGSALFCQKDAAAAWQIIGITSSLSMNLSAKDPSTVELLNTFGLPETDYIPM